MPIPSPIDELSGNELEYIRRGLSQLDLILACKDRRIGKLDEQLAIANFDNASLKNEVAQLRNTVLQLQTKLAEMEPVTIDSIKAQEAFDKLFEGL